MTETNKPTNSFPEFNVNNRLCSMRQALAFVDALFAYGQSSDPAKVHVRAALGGYPMAGALTDTESLYTHDDFLQARADAGRFAAYLRAVAEALDRLPFTRPKGGE